MTIETDMTPVEGSSNISAIGYNEAQGCLLVRYHSGGLYRYPDFPREAAGTLLDAVQSGLVSPGRAVRAAIAGYDFNRIE